MADVSVNELPLANLINGNDLFLLEQNGEAKALKGQLLTQFIDRNVVSVQVHTLPADEDAYGLFNQSTGVLQLYVPRGSGISSVTKTSTSGLEDTYTILYENGTTTTFNVTNGSSIYSISKSGSSGLTDTYTLVLTDGTQHTFTVTNGRGITSVEAISAAHTPGTSDTYRFNYNDGTHTDISIYNGKDGSGAVSSVCGKTGNVQLNAADIVFGNTNVSSALDSKQNTITVSGIVKGNGQGGLDAAILGDDYGAKTKQLRLLVADWSSNTLTITNDTFFKASGFVYDVSPKYTSLDTYSEAGVYAEDVTVNNQIVFKCKYTPSAALDVYVRRVVCS